MSGAGGGGGLRPFLELVRLPAVFTAPSDVLAGGALATAAGATLDAQPLLWAVGASALTYCAGMAANDVFDLQVDRRERPGRPIPSGRVSLAGAWRLVLGLQIGALLLASAVSVALVAAVAVTVLLTYFYNAVLKDGVLGPWAMGACRYANAGVGLVALGAGWGWVWLAPAAVLLYVAALTTLSRSEVHGATRAALRGPLVVMGISAVLPAVPALLGWLPGRWAAALVVLPLMWLAGPARRALAEPGPGAVRGAVMAGIFGIALVNGVLAAVAGQLVLAAIAVGLLIPGRAFGRWFYAT